MMMFSFYLFIFTMYIWAISKCALKTLNYSQRLEKNHIPQHFVLAEVDEMRQMETEQHCQET